MIVKLINQLKILKVERIYNLLNLVIKLNKLKDLTKKLKVTKIHHLKILQLVLERNNLRIIQDFEKKMKVITDHLEILCHLIYNLEII